MKRAHRVVVAALALLAGGTLAFAGAAPEGYRTVSDALATAEDGAEVRVKAAVVAGSVDRADGFRFAVADEARELPVVWDSTRPVPEHDAGGSIEGRVVVLTGLLARGGDGSWVLRATEMQVGCASKYEPAGE